MWTNWYIHLHLEFQSNTIPILFYIMWSQPYIYNHKTFQWQNLIAEASRQGFIGQEELQWNSYETLDGQLRRDWFQTLEQRKLMARAPSSNRAPKSPEQKKKIAQAIAADWADPDYRERVVFALAKYHLSAEKKPRAMADFTEFIHMPIGSITCTWNRRIQPKPNIQ